MERWLDLVDTRANWPTRNPVERLPDPEALTGWLDEGRISALIELGAGFHPEISGRENVFINGIMLGLTKREIQARFDDIVDFAELRRHAEGRCTWLRLIGR